MTNQTPVQTPSAGSRAATATADAPVQIPVVSAKDLAQRTNFMVGIPVGMKIALEKFAKGKEKSTAFVVRQALAQAIGYELPPEDGTAATKEKLTKEEQKKKNLEKNKARRENIKNLMSAIEKGEVALS